MVEKEEENKKRKDGEHRVGMQVCAGLTPFPFGERIKKKDSLRAT